jgi:predicted phage terminase large subunit-like protein
MPFVHHVYENFIEGRHHLEIAEKLEKVATGEITRLIVNMPPRHSKSELASYLMPAWFLGRNPKLKIIQATHNTELAVRFGRKVRDLIDSEQYGHIFPDTDLKADSKAAGRWETSAGGEYFAAGVGAAVTGRGADLFIIDDPHSEQDAMSEGRLEEAYEWYTSGPRQRLQPGGKIIVVMTRWGLRDLTGRLIKAQGSDVLSDQWEVVEFPAILPSENPLWPEFWKKDDLLKVKASLPVQKWGAQWQQQPTAEEGAIVKKEWWRIWKKEDIPEVDYIIQSYDTAFSKKESADYSAITTWGVFKSEETGADNIILMDASRGRWNFPELKEKALEENEYWQPDMMIVEAKASGLPLTDELRRAGIPIMNYTPSKGRDKVTRMHTVAPLFEAGMVWAPEKHFADEVIDECMAFPNGEHDDYVDSMTMALIRFRQGGFISLNGEEDDTDYYRPKREYY